MTPRLVILELTRLEAAHLAGLVTQFVELVDGAVTDDGDPAIARLEPFRPIASLRCHAVANDAIAR